jgi:purine-binding chemotaxis protein CheW
MENLHNRTERNEDLKQLISFTVGEEEFGLEILSVKEVIRIQEVTWLPKAPSFVKGIINLRGDVIPIIDLRDKFGLAHREYTTLTRVIVVEIEGKLIGMVVDSASQVLRIPSDQIDPPPPVIGGLSQEYITGVGKIGESLIILLNINSILAGTETIALDRIEAAVGEAAVPVQ